MRSRNETVLAHLPMVRKVAQSMMRRLSANVAFDDLVQAGCVGLIEAAERRDSARAEVPFAQFAYLRARGAMIDHLRAAHPFGRYADPAWSLAPLEDAVHVPASDDVAHTAEVRELLRRVLAAIDALPRAQRAAMTAVCLEEDDISAYAARAGVQAATVHVQMTTARRSLRALSC